MHKNVRFLDFLKSLKFRFIILITAVIVIPGVLLCSLQFMMAELWL